MALGQRRMIYTNLWQNVDFAKLSDKAKLLYIGLISIADDDGRFKASSLLLRSQIFPLDEKITQLEVRKWLNEVVRAKILEIYKENGEYFGQHPNWDKYQSIRKDLYKPSKIPKNPLRRRNGSVTKSHPNLSKDKIREEKRSIDYLSNIPEEDKKQIFERFEITEKELLSKAEDLKLYCQQKDKMYKDYKAFLFLALKKDFGPRKPKVIPRKPEEPKKEEPITQGKPIPKDIKAGIREIIGKIKQDSK